jgi:hypothetical protein
MAGDANSVVPGKIADRDSQFLDITRGRHDLSARQTRSEHGAFSALAQIALGSLIATSNFNMTAALRTVPARDKSADDMDGCCFANASRRVLTP